jgi:hypothetical protein
MLSANPAQNCGPRMGVHSWTATTGCPARLSAARSAPPLAKSLRSVTNRHEADHADDDDHTLNDAKSDMADRDAPVDAPRDAIENNHGRDVRDREQDLQQRTGPDPGVRAWIAPGLSLE